MEEEQQHNMDDTSQIDAQKSQFTLLKSRRFLPFFLTQFFGALNDNLFKNALLVILVSSGIAANGSETNTLVNMAAGLFIIPFFLGDYSPH